MGHDWMFDVLRDLVSYAQANGLPAVAAKAEELLRIAETEVGAADVMGAPAGRKRH